MFEWVLSMSARLACRFNVAITAKILSNALCAFLIINQFVIASLQVWAL